MRLRHLMSVSVVAAALGLSAATAQHVSLRMPDSAPSARSYNLLDNEVALFKNPQISVAFDFDGQAFATGKPVAVRPPLAAPPAPGYNVRLQGCNLRPSGTDATSIVVFRANEQHDMTALVSGDEYRANGGGCYAGNDYYCVGYTQFFGMTLPTLYHYDASTWSLVEVHDAPVGCISYDMTYDATDGKIYGAFYNDDMSGFVFGTLDPATVSRSVIAQLPCEYFAIAASPAGVIYGIDEDGCLTTIDKVTGNITIVGQTGVKPMFKQSADFDDTTGRLYWAGVKADQTSALYEVDVNTGAASKIFDFAIEDQILALNVLAPEAVADAPNSVENLAVDFAGGALQGVVSFTAPDHTFGGTPLSGQLTYEVAIDGTRHDSGQVAPGAARQVSITLAESGFHEVSVSTANTAGRSPVVVKRQWFGFDNPRGVENLTLTSDDDNLCLSWDAPSTGVNGGCVNTAALRYTVVRQPGNVTVADRQQATTFTEPYSKEGMASYQYEVTVCAGDFTSEKVVSDKLLAGSAFTVPYTENFDSPSAADLFTVIDVHGDNKTWMHNYDADTSTGDMRCSYSNSNPKDDWLISPPVKLEAGRLYNLSVQVMARGGATYPEKLTVVLATAPTPEAMTAATATTVIGTREFKSRAFEEVSGLFNIAADGTYYIGIHASSDRYMDVLAVDNLKIVAEAGFDAPAAVTSLEAVADADGSTGVTLTFRTPTLTINDDRLAGIEKVEIYRDNTLAHTIEPVGVGQTYSWHDDAALQGMNTYEVRATNGDKRGLPASVQVYAGFDVPGRPTNVRISEAAGTVTLTWEAPVRGEHGGVIDTSSMTYLVVDSEGELVKSDITGTRWEFNLQIPSGQDLYAWSVAARNAQGMGNATRSNILALGQPNGLPFVESFPRAVNQTSPWGQVVSGMGGRWFTSDTGLRPIASPQDRDGGLLTFIPADDNDEALIYSGKIEVASATAPVVDFWYYKADGVACNLALEVSANHGAFAKVADVDFDAAHAGWNFARMPLDGIDCSDFVQIGFRASTGSVGRRVHIDNIVLRDPAKYDLAALDVAAPADIKVGQPTTVTATLMNVGTMPAQDYSVELWVNGMLLQTVAGKPLEPLATAAYDFDVVPTVAMSTKAAFGMKIVYAADKNLIDNTLIAADVNVEMPVWPTVTDLSGSYDGTNVNLEWSAAADAVVDPQPLTDRFEQYEPFIIDNIGDWTVVDIDGGTGTYTINNTSSTSVDYPNAGKPMAFQVFNPSHAGLLLVNGEGSPTGWMPHSGSQMLAAFADRDGQNDDWLISPRLSGQAQTVTFYARSYSDMYGLETIEVLTSATDRATTSFERVKGVAANVPAAWTLYSIELPEGTQYFAIRCTSSNHFVLLVDDISYVPAGATPVALSVQGYNVYRNGKLLTDTPVSEPRFSEPFAPGQLPKYAVTAVYDKGESNFSNIVTVATTGISDAAGATLKVISDSGRLIVEGARGADVTVVGADGSVAWSGVPATDSHAVALPAGIYIVTARGVALKAAVR